MPIRIESPSFVSPIKIKETPSSEEEKKPVQAQLITRSGVRIVTLEEND
ncbi:MAG: hypothetical protein K2X08_02650 [Chlamydiales bacterium]|nr:hypothetical protein [Chlamydiales bacterium]